MDALLSPAAVEARVLDLVDRVIGGERVEDSLVECKADWPDPAKAARQLGGLANAARLQPILWIVGLDEDAHTIYPTKSLELADWWSQLLRSFDGDVAPSMLHNLRVPVDVNRAVFALYFDTSRAPFVIKSLAGSAPGGIDKDVPWREGNRTRSAARHELLRILVPVVGIPTVQGLKFSLDAHLNSDKADKGIALHLNGSLFFDAPPRSTVVIPEHLIRASVEFADVGPSGVEPPRQTLEFIQLSMPARGTGLDYVGFGQSEPIAGHPMGVDVVHQAIYISGPGKAVFRGRADLPAAYLSAIGEWRHALLRISMHALVADAEVATEIHLARVVDEPRAGMWDRARWEQYAQPSATGGEMGSGKP